MEQKEETKEIYRVISEKQILSIVDVLNKCASQGVASCVAVLMMLPIVNLKQEETKETKAE